MNNQIRSANQVARTPNRSHHLRANGNLSYLDFIRVIRQLWAEGHPTIPILMAGVPVMAQYPCIIVSLNMRKAHQADPKPRQREVINTGKMLAKEDGTIEASQKAVIIMGQKFVNEVKFTAVDKVSSDGAQVADELIEVFEDFILQYTPLLKYLGAADLFYNRRFPDDEEHRMGDDVVKRSVSYLVTIEKIMQTEVDKLERILSTIRVGYEDDEATPGDPSPYEPLYAEDLAADDARLVNGIWERPQIIDSFRTPTD
jgi:hypothetical protein